MWDSRWASWRAMARRVAVVSVGDWRVSVKGAGNAWVEEEGKSGCGVEEVRPERKLLANIVVRSDF